MSLTTLPPTCHEQHPEIVSYWRLGAQITGGRWYSLYHAAPKSGSAENGFGYVIKLVNPDLKSEHKERAIDRLGREALATEQVLHPNVVRLLDAELDAAPFFLVQPWLSGRSLDRFLSSSREMSLSRMLWLVRQLAEGIHAAHEKGRAHLGLEPSHVILGRTGRATLLGWSQSHAFGQMAWLPHDQLQLARYTAPECFHTDYRAQSASDVYSLGALIYHALSLKAPFDGATVTDLADAHHQEIPADLMFVQPQCPPALNALVKEMMFKDPSRRPDFRHVLNRLIGIEIDHLNDQTMIQL